MLFYKVVNSLFALFFFVCIIFPIGIILGVVSGAIIAIAFSNETTKLLLLKGEEVINEIYIKKKVKEIMRQNTLDL